MCVNPTKLYLPFNFSFEIPVAFVPFFIYLQFRYFKQDTLCKQRSKNGAIVWQSEFPNHLPSLQIYFLLAEWFYYCSEISVFFLQVNDSLQINTPLLNLFYHSIEEFNHLFFLTHFLNHYPCHEQNLSKGFNR